MMDVNRKSLVHFQWVETIKTSLQAASLGTKQGFNFPQCTAGTHWETAADSLLPNELDQDVLMDLFPQGRGRVWVCWGAEGRGCFQADLQQINNICYRLAGSGWLTTGFPSRRRVVVPFLHDCVHFSSAESLRKSLQYSNKFTWKTSGGWGNWQQIYHVRGHHP